MSTPIPSPLTPGVVRRLVLTRTFDAPRELVFKAWTEAKHVAQWWGPKDFTNPVCQWEAHPGNTICIDMTAPDGTVNRVNGTFLEVTPPERLVFTCSAFPDEDGNDTHEVYNVITFAERGGKTEMTLQADVLKLAADMLEALDGMEEGWSQSLDRLAAVVAKL